MMKPLAKLLVVSLLASVLGPASAFAAPPAAPSARPAAPPVTEGETPAQQASKLREAANEAMLGMRYADGLVAYQKALELTPDDAGLYYSIARAHQFLGDYPEALDALEAFDKKATREMRAKVGKLDALYAEIRPRVGVLNLACDMVGARVLVRNKVIGTTPLPATRIGSGAAFVQLELDGFFTESRPITVPGGGELSLKVELHKKATSGFLAISTVPMGAIVSVDGRELGTSSPTLELSLPSGPHELIARRDGYDEARVPIVLSPGATRDVSIPLEQKRAITTRWWFWTGIGVAIAGGVALTYALTTERSAGRGSLSPSQVTGP
jgi:hypothetical protein